MAEVLKRTGEFIQMQATACILLAIRKEDAVGEGRTRPPGGLLQLLECLIILAGHTMQLLVGRSGR